MQQSQKTSQRHVVCNAEGYSRGNVIPACGNQRRLHRGEIISTEYWIIRHSCWDSCWYVLELMTWFPNWELRLSSYMILNNCLSLSKPMFPLLWNETPTFHPASMRMPSAMPANTICSAIITSLGRKRPSLNNSSCSGVKLRPSANG